ncbi:MAG TPA: Fe-S protein assembly co-chaperone HscB [Polyangiaceae bacterium]|nr:Fe-S protein assembly co-chaperone HscB [Polyangiaceae bacterium]
MNDPFATLGIDPAFRIDLPAVEQRHRDLSRALHPDKFAGAPAAERRLSLNRAIEVNEAWRAVRDPIRRAEALMRRAGVPVGEIEEPKPSPDLLMEMMESREALAEAAQKKDLAAVKRLGEEMSARMDATLLALGTGFAEAGADRAKLSALLPKMGELRYIRRFLDEVSAFEEEMLV